MKETVAHNGGFRGRDDTAALLFKTSWGWMGLKAGTKGLQAIVLPKTSKRAVEAELGDGIATAGRDPRTVAVLRQARAQLSAYLAGRGKSFHLPLDLSSGTPFQRRVWRAIARVPYGRVRSYKWVATKIGGDRYARAVGNALGANPIPIIVPCHRAVAHDASLGGFSGGLPTKRRLLSLEGTLPMLRSDAGGSPAGRRGRASLARR